MDPPRDRTTVKVDRFVSFEVPVGWEFVRKLGSGAYGTVACFKRPTANGEGETIAVKKVAPSLRHRSEARCLLREIKLMQSIYHATVLGCLALWQNSSMEPKEVYIVTPLMDTDLHRILHAQKVKLTQHLVKILTYQLLQGLLVLHFAHVIHRDLKPSNVLVDVRGRLKIGDLGLGRGTPEDEDADLTQYVVTRWYRAPEIVLKAGCYTRAIDTWSAGCIIFEMLTNRILFKGRDYLDQVKSILSVIGTPPEAELNWLTEEARSFVLQFERSPQQSVGAQPELAKAGEDVLSLMDALLKFNPEERMEVTEAIRHPYLESFYRPEHVETCREAWNGAEPWNEAEEVLSGPDWVKVFRGIIDLEAMKYAGKLNPRRSSRSSGEPARSSSGELKARPRESERRPSRGEAGTDRPAPEPRPSLEKVEKPR